MKKAIYSTAALLFAFLAVFAQPKTAVKNCPCTGSLDISEWTPNLNKGYDTTAYANNFAHSINGVYVAEDRDSVYQIKIIVDAHSYASFVHFQHLSFSKARLTGRVTNCEYLPNVKDGGWIDRSILAPSSSIAKKFVASTFFVGESYFRVNKTHFYRLYKCDKESRFGIHDAARERFYRKVYWEPKGDFTEISLFGFTQKEVKKYNKQQLATMRNGVYARYNYAFKEGGAWFKYFEEKPDYRWNYFKDVTRFITTLEKDNLSYIIAFESTDYYDNQFNNDFLEFWQKFRENAQQSDQEKLHAQIQFPLLIHGEHDNMPAIKINQQQFEKIWPLLLQQENYDIGKTGRPVAWLSKSAFSKADAFAEQMIHAKANSIANLNFEKLNGVWKLNSAYANLELYPKIQNILKMSNAKK